MSRRYLILCSNEINYNPRLLKAADYLRAHGEDVTVFNTITGISSYDLYQDVTGKRKWKVIGNRIDKRTFGSRLRWLYCSLVNAAVRFTWKNFSWETGAKFMMQKGLATARINPHAYDVVILHLVDSLPFAAGLKRRNKQLKIVYDSQEYFRGQYEHNESYVKDWVVKMEEKYIGQADIVLATTEVMRKRIEADYHLKVPMFRVRNVPYQRLEHQDAGSSEGPLKIIWHGMMIIYGNRRGLQTIVQAISKCRTEVHLYLQGLQRDHDMKNLSDALSALNIEDKVTIVPAAHPDKIVESLVNYDVGICSEIPEEENQRLTSSNKLFEYLAAGLCGIVTDVPGLTETLHEFDAGLIYEPGNADDLAAKLDQLNSDRTLLTKYRQNARKAAQTELYWEHDYDPVYQAIQQLKPALA